MISLWIDDVRTPPAGWAWAKNSVDAIALLGSLTFDEVSFDHDLGGDDTSRKIVLWMCENEVWPHVLHVHTQNPVGREWLVGMINRYGPGISSIKY